QSIFRLVTSYPPQSFYLGTAISFFDNFLYQALRQDGCAYCTLQISKLWNFGRCVLAFDQKECRTCATVQRCGIEGPGQTTCSMWVRLQFYQFARDQSFCNCFLLDCSFSAQVEAYPLVRYTMGSRYFFFTDLCRCPLSF